MHVAWDERQHLAAQITMEIDSVLPQLDKATADWSAGVDHGGEWPSKIVSAKYHAVESAKRVCDMAMEMSGGGGIFKANELERLYRDVHDGPAQVLANAVFEVEYLERIAERAPADVRSTLRTELANLKSQFRSSLDSVRGMIYDLRPPVLSELGLAEAIRNYANEYQSRYGLRVECHLDTTDTGLLPMQELAIYRVMQEALQNVHKHAQATSVGIVWQCAKDQVVLHCTDDGIGFDLVKAARRVKSVGLLSMRERAELIGGRLQIQSTPGAGTAVTLLLPLAKEGDTRGR